MFRLMLSLVIGLMHAYVFWRIAAVPFVARALSGRALALLALLLWVGFLCSVFFGPRDSGPVAHWLELWSMTWMGMLFLLTTVLLCADLLTAFGLIFRHAAPTLRGMALLAGLALSALALIQGGRAPVVRTYEAALPGLPPDRDGTRVAVLTDLHLGAILGEHWLAARVAQVQALHPDLIVLVGDVFDGRPPTPEVEDALRRFAAPLGVWGVLGNHETYMPNPAAIGPAFARSGVRLLRNARAELAPGLLLAGVDNLSSQREAPLIPEYFSRALDGRPRDGTILLTHAPVGAELAAGKGVGLLLAGHTHGGQIWPFGYLVERAFPLLAGRYDVSGMTVLVSRGMGTWGPRMRLWNPAEILLVTLRSGS